MGRKSFNGLCHHEKRLLSPFAFLARNDSRPIQPVTAKPLTEAQRQRLADAAWAEEDPQVIASYPGEFVVPHDLSLIHI